MLNENCDHQDKDDNIENQDGKDGSEEGTKEYCRVTDEAAAGRTQVMSVITLYCSMHPVTYNPRIFGVGLRTTRSPLTATERSTAIGITTGMMGTTKEQKFHQEIFKPLILISF